MTADRDALRDRLDAVADAVETDEPLVVTVARDTRVGGDGGETTVVIGGDT